MSSAARTARRKSRKLRTKNGNISVAVARRVSEEKREIRMVIIKHWWKLAEKMEYAKTPRTDK